MHALRALTIFITFALPTALSATTVKVGTGSGEYTNIQAAVNALPSGGGEIDVTAGTYKEQVTITKPNVRLIGQGSSRSATILTDDLSSSGSSDQASSTLIVTAGGFFMENITVQNTYTQEGHTQVPAVAVFLRSDKSVFRNVSLIGRQDTLYLGSQGCSSSTCTPARTYIYGSAIEGNVDFIFGDGAAVFDTCNINLDEHGSASGETTITAQNKSFTNYLSGYVFWSSQINAEASGLTNDYLGRPWGKYSTNIFVNTSMQAPITSAGWIEFTPGSTNNLPTAYYAEYGSSGTGAAGYTNKTRETYAVYLTSTQANQYAPNTYLAGSDGWKPTAVN
jgi:pectin methylesterase-like acyl-CoA thioesterase